MATPLKIRIQTRISRKKGDVVLPGDFSDLAGSDQVQRALRELARAKLIIRLGYGVYAKARLSSISGRAVLASPEGFQGVARQALTRLGVKWEPTEAERAYNEGRSTQVPVNAVVNVKGRFSRKLHYGKSELVVGR